VMKGSLGGGGKGTKNEDFSKRERVRKKKVAVFLRKKKRKEDEGGEKTTIEEGVWGWQQAGLGGGIVWARGNANASKKG